jgi:hypothetical protein
MKNMPDIVQIGYLGLDGYVTQGYYALSLALGEPFEPMWGLGNSTFLTRQLTRITGDASFERKSYPARIEKYGWDAYGLWSSIYPWFASDVSFPGVIILVFVIGYLFARVWLDVLYGSNPWAIVLFSNLIIMLAYFPANNQVFQSGEGLVTFYGCLIGWFLTRSRSANLSALEGAGMRAKAA